jgi:hypothetical protein
MIDGGVTEEEEISQDDMLNITTNRCVFPFIQSYKTLRGMPIESLCYCFNLGCFKA